MQYNELVKIYEMLEATTKKLEKKDILAAFYKKCTKDELEKVVLLSVGTVFPAKEEDLGIANEMMKKVIAKAYGVSEKELEGKFKSTGDLGLTAEYFSKHKKQRSLSTKILTIDMVFENLRKLPSITGMGSQENKVALISELLAYASGAEAKYIVRTTINEMRIGVAEGIVRDAIAEAFNQDVKEVEKTHDVTNDYGKVALMAKSGKLKTEIELGRPIKVMLADRAKGLKDALGKFENVAIETKYDGFRISINKDGNAIKLFSRRLDDVTRQFPEIVSWSKECIKANQCIVEGEALAIDEKTGMPLPFQNLSRRIQRKYDIEKMAKEIPIQVNLFELIYLDGKSYMERPLRERWQTLCKILKEKKNKFRLADHIETKDLKEAEKFFKQSLASGQEGVIVKNLDANYQPGRRVGYWLKVKEIMDPLDLVITGGIYGEGKRARWIGSLILSAKKGDELIETGKMASGLTEEQMEEITKQMKKIITEEKGTEVKVKPEIVIEVGYEEIQKSPKYPSGFALRFPKLLRFRPDKAPEDASTLKEIEKLYKQQRGKK